MKRFYHVRFGYPGLRFRSQETALNENRTHEDCYSGISEAFEYDCGDQVYCHRSHAVGREILGMLADGQTIDSRNDVIALGESHLAFASDREKALADAKIELGTVIPVRWEVRFDDRSYFTPAMAPKELVIARPDLHDDDEPACKHCGSPRMFCGECLAFLGFCSECGGALSRFDLYESVDDSRKRRNAGDITFCDECIVADVANYDVVASALRREYGPSSIYYSEELLSFVAGRLMCQIAVMPLPMHSRAKYRQILETIGAI